VSAPSSKRLLLHAAGEEGLASNVAGLPPFHFSHSANSAYHTEYQIIPCIDTSGQTFGIWLNVFYLTPLTALFVHFFVKSYLRRLSSKGEATRVEKAGMDALKGVEKEMVRGEGRVASANGKPSNGHAKNGSPNGKKN
jgi:hypothetical protein